MNNGFLSLSLSLIGLKCLCSLFANIGKKHQRDNFFATNILCPSAENHPSSSLGLVNKNDTMLSRFTMVFMALMSTWVCLPSKERSD